MKMLSWIPLTVLVVWCSLGPVWGRDGKNTDRPGGSVPVRLDGRQMKEREAIRSFILWIMMEQMIIKWTGGFSIGDAAAMKREQESFPAEALKKCPEEFRMIWKDVLSWCAGRKIPMRKLSPEKLEKVEIRIREQLVRYDLQRFVASSAPLFFVMNVLNPENVAHPDEKEWRRRAADFRSRLETGTPPLPSVEEMLAWTVEVEKEMVRDLNRREGRPEDEGVNDRDYETVTDDDANVMLWYVFGMSGENDKDDDSFF